MRPRSFPLDFRNLNALWASVAVETLARRGIRHAVISPGSRSTPLTVQFARHPHIEAIPVLDERSAAFFALGLARQSNRPVILLCTSGTAGANYFPAIIEARESGVPLLVITADRPPEMRECRSGQTIDQQKLFGSYVNYYHELAMSDARLSMLQYLRQTVAHAVERTLWPFGGPVHLNAPFRDPLPPVAGAADLGGLKDRLATRDFFAGLRECEASSPLPAPSRYDERFPARGLIVAGQARPADPAAYARAVGAMAKRLGWPVLADALSPLRNFRKLVPNLVTSYDVLARSPSARSLIPDHVICLHDWPTSKALRQWLTEPAVSSRLRVTFVSSRPENPDALHLATRMVRAAAEDFARHAHGAAPDARWMREWKRRDKRAADGLARGIDASHEAFEGRVAAMLPDALPAETTVVVANSMPVRDLEYFWPANDRGCVVHCNRGANGIDGTLSTALGIAHAGPATVLLTGDLAFLHDANGLLLAPKFRGSLAILLINNHGGGIFEHLPVAQFNPPFEEFFATPQTIDFALLCAAHGVPHKLIRRTESLRRELAKSAKGVRVLEIRTDRKKDAAFRKQLFEKLSET